MSTGQQRPQYNRGGSAPRGNFGGGNRGGGAGKGFSFSVFQETSKKTGKPYLGVQIDERTLSALKSAEVGGRVFISQEPETGTSKAGKEYTKFRVSILPPSNA